jgi:hypothetical protein
MIETKSKEELTRLPGELYMVACILTKDRAEAIATRNGYYAWFWEKRSQRLYGKSRIPRKQGQTQRAGASHETV